METNNEVTAQNSQDFEWEEEWGLPPPADKDKKEILNQLQQLQEATNHMLTLLNRQQQLIERIILHFARGSLAEQGWIRGAGRGRGYLQ